MKRNFKQIIFYLCHQAQNNKPLPTPQLNQTKKFLSFNRSKPYKLLASQMLLMLLSKYTLHPAFQTTSWHQGNESIVCSKAGFELATNHDNGILMHTYYYQHSVGDVFYSLIIDTQSIRLQSASYMQAICKLYASYMQAI